MADVTASQLNHAAFKVARAGTGIVFTVRMAELSLIITNIQGQPLAPGQPPRQYYASYGRSQFVAATLIETLNNFSTQEKAAIGITADIQRRITAAQIRAVEVGRNSVRNPGWFRFARENYTCSEAVFAWDNAGQIGALSIQDRSDFQSQTLLDRQAFIDMVCFVPQGNARPIGEGRNAFITESIFADATLKTWLLDLYKSVDRFNFISRTFIRNNLRRVLRNSQLSSQFVNNVSPTLASGQPNPAYTQRQREVEEGIAKRTARLHNGGGSPFDPNITTLTRNCNAGSPCDIGSYVKSFIGISAGRGDWRSLRCGTPQGGNQALHGLELTPLKLN